MEVYGSGTADVAAVFAFVGGRLRNIANEISKLNQNSSFVTLRSKKVSSFKNWLKIGCKASEFRKHVNKKFSDLTKIGYDYCLLDSNV